MKKIVLIVLLSSSFSFALAPWSSETVDQVHAAFQEYDLFVKQQNEALKQRYGVDLQPVINDILQNQKYKELHFRHIAIMNVDSTMDKGNLNFEYEKFKQLKNKQGDE